MRRRTLFGAIVLPAALGVLASFGVASASSLEVDGGVAQVWEIPSGLGPEKASSVDDPDSAPTDPPVGTDVGSPGPGE